MTTPKRKRCRVCRELFEIRNSFQRVCSPGCAIEYAKTEEGQKNAKQQRGRELLGQKRKLREHNRSWWLKEAQKAFNGFIRKRDEGLPCVSCGTLTPKLGRYGKAGAWDAGHYRTVGACPELRFEPLNCHRQCVQCNHHRSGNVVEYRIRLMDRIGAANLEWLEGPHEPKKYTIDDLREVRDHFKRLTKQLEEKAA